MFEIEKGYAGQIKYRHEYSVQQNGFRAMVTVHHHPKAEPFIYHHYCSEGGGKLWDVDFWNIMCEEVINYHKILQNEKQSCKSI